MSETGSARRGNGFEPKQAKLWMGEIEKKHQELLDLRMQYMADCKEVREEIKDILDRAKDSGIPKKTIKAALKIRELSNRIETIAAGGEAEDNETLEQFRHALGDLADTPLGEAASKKKSKGMPGADAPGSVN